VDRRKPPPAAGDDPQAMVAVGEEELAECRTLLGLLGVPHMVAPGESDAQCAHLVRTGHAWAAVTQDWDIALFGSPRAIRNLTSSRTRTPELLDLEAALSAAGLTHGQLVDVAILIGTDYNEGIPGVGPVKALTLIRRHGDLRRALAALGKSIPRVEEVRGVFLDHPLDRRFRPTFRRPDAAKAAEFLEGRGMSPERALVLIQAMEKGGVAGAK
jgi:flap endonuclease-1